MTKLAATFLVVAFAAGEPPPAAEGTFTAILAEVAHRRGLEVLAPVAHEVVSTAAIRAHLDQELRTAYPGDALERMGRALMHFALIPYGFDLPGYYAAFLESRVGGYYDAATKTLFLAKNLDIGQDKTLLAHELVHALQDQHYDLAAFLADTAGDSEAYLARSALIEGDALAIEIEYGLGDRGIGIEMLGDLSALTAARIAALRQSASGLAAAPFFLVESSYFPYSYGLGFVQALRRAQPRTWLDRVYENPPRSSEQILHPERYIEVRDDPTLVTIPDLGVTLPGWREEWTDVAGEIGTRAVLEVRAGDPAVSASAAAGWDGDRYLALVHEGDGRYGVVWSLVWDSPCDADEFYATYAQVVPARRSDALSKARSRPEVTAWSTDRGDYLLARDGVRVFAIEGFPDEESLAILGVLAPGLAIAEP